MFFNKFKQMFPLGSENTQYASFFTGVSYFSGLISNKEMLIYNLTFEPNCRLKWHSHNGASQVLICTAGKGLYQMEGQEVKKVKPGDVIEIPSGVMHWHGAEKNSWFSHLSIIPMLKDVSSEWSPLPKKDL